MLAFQWIGDPDPDPDPDPEDEDCDLDHDNDDKDGDHDHPVAILIMIHEYGVDGGQESNFREDKKSRRHMALLKLEWQRLS